MSRTTSDVLVERLMDWGVHVVFGLPGDGINGIMEALRRRQDRISFLLVRRLLGGSGTGAGAVHAKSPGPVGPGLPGNRSRGAGLPP